MKNCPCGTEKNYFDCCGAFISNQKIPSTPEKLMRSRYTAYTQANIDYIANTMKSFAAENFDAEAARVWAKKIKWAGLDVVKTSHDSTKGMVEFFAHYYSNNKKHELHEISEFHFEEGRWFYVNGTQFNERVIMQKERKIGRNDICPCGSHKKYKKCCG